MGILSSNAEVMCDSKAIRLANSDNNVGSKHKVKAR